MMQRIVLFILLLCLNPLLHAEEIVAPKLPENAPRPLKIGVAVFVNNIAKVNDQAGTFEANVDVQLRWKDTELAFDSQTMGTNRLEFAREMADKKLTRIWNPALTLANAEVKNLEQGLFIYADGTVVHIQRLKAVFDAKYKLAAFPFDTQALPIKIVSEKYDMNQIALVQDQSDINNSGLSEKVKLSAWQPQDVEFVSSRSRSWNGQYFPQMQAEILLTRIPGSHLFTILMPFLLVMLVPTVATLYTKMDIEKRLGFWSSSILALIALSFTFATRLSMLPSDSIVMQLIVIGSGYQIVMILLSITLLNPAVAERCSNKFIVSETLSYLRWTIPLALIGLVLTRVLLTALL